MIKFQKGDSVIVTSGKDKGHKGEVERVFADKQTLVLPGANMYKRHIKAAYAADQKGGIYDIPRPLNFAKIALICPNCKKPTRVGFRIEGGKKVRVCKKCDRIIETKQNKK